MSVSYNSRFEARDFEEIAAGIAYYRGWHTGSDPVWSRGGDATLRIDATLFPEPVKIVVELKAFHCDADMPSSLTISSDGHEDVTIAEPVRTPQFVTFQTPVMAPGAKWGFVRLHSNAPSVSPYQLGLSIDERLLGFRIVPVGIDVPTLSFPVDLGDGGVARMLLARGWDEIEPETGVWSLSDAPCLVFPAYLDLSHAKALRFDVQVLPRPDDRPPLEVEIWTVNACVGSVDFRDRDAASLLCPLEGCRPGADLEVTFKLSDLASPAELGVSADTRILGLLLRSIDLVMED